VNLGFRTHQIDRISRLPRTMWAGLADPLNWHLHFAPGDLFDGNHQSTLHFQRRRQRPASAPADLPAPPSMEDLRPETEEPFIPLEYDDTWNDLDPYDGDSV
jgi:hypothetical protein